MEYQDYYQILQIDKHASLEAIEQAHQKLVESHADHSGDTETEALLLTIDEAYNVLSHPDKRARYDKLSLQWQTAPNKETFDWGAWISEPNGSDPLTPGVGFSEFYHHIFADLTSADPTGFARPGEDYYQKVEINLEEAFRGTSRVLKVGNRRIEIKIPRGAKPGTQVRVKNEGGDGENGGPKGDLYLDIEVAAHDMFERKGDDLHMDLPVDLFTAALGGEALVPTFDGRIKLKIPAESQSGRTFRIRGHGMPLLQKSGQRGDLYAKVMIQLPENLTDEEIALFEELADLRGM